MLQAPVIRQEAHEVPLGQVEATLARLGREANSGAPGTAMSSVARSSVMTLVAYARGAEQARRVSRAVEGLTGQHPSRSIILAVQPDDQSLALSSTVSLHCHTPHAGANPICAEQIMINANGAISQHLSGVVLPLLLTELPVFVWWTGEMPSGDLVTNLLETCDRAILDSADFRDPAADFVNFATLLEHQRARTAFSDFNWTRIKSWRELTAQFFDADRFQPYLGGIERVEIEYAVVDGERPNPMQALLYAGWLAARLKWTTWTGMHDAKGMIRLGLKTPQNAPLTIEIAPRTVSTMRDWWAMSSASWPALPIDDHDVQSNGNDHGHAALGPSVGVGALMRVNLQARVSGNPATFTVLREDDLRNATTIVVAAGETVPQRCTPLDTLGEAALLSQQLAIFGHDPYFEDATLAAKVMATSDGYRTRGAR